MRRIFARALASAALAAALLPASPQAAANPCRTACKAAKKTCLRATNVSYARAKKDCAAAASPADRRACKLSARRARSAAKAACKAGQAPCVANCDSPRQTTTTTVQGVTTSSTTAVPTTTVNPTSTTSTTVTTTTTTLPGPSCGDTEAPGVRGITRAHDAVRADPSLDGGGVPQPAPDPALEPLCYSASVAAVAEGWADRCTFAHNAHRGHLGENLYAHTGVASPTSVTDAVTWWSAESRYFDYASNTCSAPNPPGTCGHYTQVVWRETAALGCAARVCAVNSPFPGFTTWTYVVCNYEPPGNVTLCDRNGCVLQRPY